MNSPVYLDYNPTTPVAAEVLEAMLPYLTQHFGNPSSSHHYGGRATEAVRASVADFLGAVADEIVFTGSATEANNLALLDAARALGGRKRHLVVSAVEHSAVIEPALYLQSGGWELSVVPVDAYGRVDPAAVAAALRPDTALVSIMHADNEVGTIQPVAEIAAITKTRGILLHTDAAQSAGKIPLNADALGVDLLTLAGHKFYAPKRGALLMFGQERRSRRSSSAPGRSAGCVQARRTCRRWSASARRQGLRANVCRQRRKNCARCATRCTNG